MRVLVCDDDRVVAEFLQAMFEVDGWEVAAVDSGEACLARLDGPEPAPDLLVLDQVMPGLTGIAVAETLRARGLDLPIILCSAHLGPEHRADIARLDLLQMNKIDMQAVVRVGRAAVREAALRAGTPPRA